MTAEAIGEREAGARSGAAVPGPAPAPANDWRTLLLLFTLAGAVESQAFGHLGAFTPLFLQQLQVPPAQIPTWTGVLSALGFVLGLPLKVALVLAGLLIAAPFTVAFMMQIIRQLPMMGLWH